MEKFKKGNKYWTINPSKHEEVRSKYKIKKVAPKQIILTGKLGNKYMFVRSPNCKKECSNFRSLSRKDLFLTYEDAQKEYTNYLFKQYVFHERLSKKYWKIASENLNKETKNG